MLGRSPLATLTWLVQAAFFLPFRFYVGEEASGWCSQGCQAMVDTGTSLLTVPQQYLSYLLQAIGAKEGEYGQVGVTWMSPSQERSV